MTSSEIILWQYPPGFGLPSLSPFCVKVEVYLRLRRLPYTVRVTNNPKRGPLGKMPVVQEGDRQIADSRLIITSLEASHGEGLDAHLGQKERGLGLAVQRLVEEHLYFAIMRSRWMDEDGFAACRREFSPAFPLGLRHLALRMIRGMLRKQCVGQGFGRLSHASAEALAVADVEAIEALVQEPFLLGGRPTSFDASLFAFLATIRSFPSDSAMRRRLTGSAKLTAYLQRMELACGLGTSAS